MCESLDSGTEEGVRGWHRFSGLDRYTTRVMCLGGVRFFPTVFLEVLERSGIAIKRCIKRLCHCTPLIKHYSWGLEPAWSLTHTGKNTMVKTKPVVNLVVCAVANLEKFIPLCVNIRHWISWLWICMHSYCHLAGRLEAQCNTSLNKIHQQL